MTEALTAPTDSLPVNAIEIVISGSVGIGEFRYLAGTAMLKGPPFPPTYIAFVARTAPNQPTVYQIFVQGSYDRPVVSIAKGAEGQLAFAATQKPNKSGSSPTFIRLGRLDPLTLATWPAPCSPRHETKRTRRTRTSTSAPSPSRCQAVTGTKSGAIPGELGLVGDGHFQATYAAFASSTTLGLAPAQVLAW